MVILGFPSFFDETLKSPSFVLLGATILNLTLECIMRSETYTTNSLGRYFLRIFWNIKDLSIYIVKLIASKKNVFNTEDENFIEFTKNQNTNTRKSLLQSYDQLLNNKYKVQLNQKTIERVKEYFKW